MIVLMMVTSTMLIAMTTYGDDYYQHEEPR